MAFADDRMGRNRRAATLAIVALIQGGVMIALVEGLAVHFLPAPPEHHTEGAQMALPPPPPQPMPPRQRPKPAMPRTIQPILPIPREISRPALPDPLPTGAAFDPLPTSSATADPLPQPTTMGMPREARALNDRRQWVIDRDYPARELREGDAGVTGFRLTIGTDGRVVDCAITASSGFAGLDAATCARIAQRARFAPATDGSGRIVAGTYRGTLRWRIPD